MLRITALLAAAGLAHSQWTSKPWLFDNGDDRNRLTGAYAGELPDVTVLAQNSWTPGWMPWRCESEAYRWGYNPQDIEVRNVTYADCPVPWTLCRHKDSRIGWDFYINYFGRQPIGMRQYIGISSLFPDDAYSSGDGFYLCGWAWFGDFSVSFAPWCWDMFTIIHEGGHMLDSANVLTSGSMYSDTTPWITARNADTHVVTEYSQSYTYEHFADTATWGLAEIVHNGGLDDYDPAWRTTVYNTVTKFVQVFTPIMYPTGGVCTARVSAGDPVYVGTAAGRSSPGPKPDVDAAFAGTGVRKIEIDLARKDQGAQTLPLAGKQGSRIKGRFHGRQSSMPRKAI